MSETRFEIDTPLGPVWFWGRDTGKPILLFIGGIVAPLEFGEPLHAQLPGVDLVRAHIAGLHWRGLREVSFSCLSAGFDSALGQIAGDRPVAVFGHSAGAVVALGMRLPNIRRVIVTEPILRTGDVWPLRAFRQAGWAGWERLLWPLMGVDATRHEPRDYTHLLETLATPTLALLGDVPLMPERLLDHQPSLVDDETRRLLAEHPLIEVRTLPGGHSIAGSPRLMPPLREVLTEAFGGQHRPS